MREAPEIREDDVLVPVAGILDVLDNYAFVRTTGYLPGPSDVYVPMQMIKRHGLRKGDAVIGRIKPRHDLEDDYLPRARKTAETTGTVLKAAVDAARKELDKGQGDIRSAIVEPTPQKKKGRAGKVLLILGLAAAGAAAGYIAWQKPRPVEDPWAPPADFARAHYPASAGTESDSSTVSDTVGSADAGDGTTRG